MSLLSMHSRRLHQSDVVSELTALGAVFTLKFRVVLLNAPEANFRSYLILPNRNVTFIEGN